MSRTPDQLVPQEVHYCVSYLVSTLAQGQGSIVLNRIADNPLGELVDQAAELCAPIDDWEEAAFQAGWTEVEDPELGKTLFNAELERFWPAGDWQGACEDSDIEPYQREVFEHWLVSDWLADQLIRRGEKVDKDFAGMTVWARTTSGQGIASDSVIEAICAELNKG